jgi:hypothetical protein
MSMSLNFSDHQSHCERRRKQHGGLEKGAHDEQVTGSCENEKVKKNNGG